jgi:hypothetical protein
MEMELNFLNEEDDRRFMEHLRSTCENKSDHPNPDAYAIFNGIQNAFSKNWKEVWGNTVPITPRLVEFLSASASVALNYNKDERVPWDRHDSVCKQSLRWLMVTIRHAVKEGRTVELEDGETYHGCLMIPKWYVEQCRAFPHKVA